MDGSYAGPLIKVAIEFLANYLYTIISGFFCDLNIGQNITVLGACTIMGYYHIPSLELLTLTYSNKTTRQASWIPAFAGMT